MGTQAVLEQGATVLLVLVVASLLLGQLLGQPMLIAYVQPESTSMEPTIGAGDGFIAIPSFAAGDPRPGDVVVFQAEVIEGGGITTHRVIDETADGYITRGDNNPFTDQDGGEPPVSDDQIVAHAAQVGGYTITIPALGTGIQTIQGGILAAVAPVAAAAGLELDTTGELLGAGLFGLGVLLFGVSLIRDRGGSPHRTVSRSAAVTDRLDTRLVAVALLLIVLIPANATMLLASGPTDLTVDGEEVADTAGVAPGDPIDSEFEIRNDGLLTMVFMLDPGAEDVTMSQPGVAIPPGETATVTASIPAPAPDADRTVTVMERRYFLLLPDTVVFALHDYSPLAVLAVLNLFLSVSVLGFIGGLFGFNEVRLRNTDRDVPLSLVLKRKLRR